MEPEDSTQSLHKKQTKFIREATGTFLFYARAVDSTMLTALIAIASEQKKPTENTLKKIKQFLDYATTNSDAIITYHISNMIQAAQSYASYLSEPKA